MRRYAPGPGWRYVSGPVYERADGVRVHMLGVVWLPGEPLISGNHWPEYKEMCRMIAINGGNRKRGLMAWANAVESVHNAISTPNGVQPKEQEMAKE